MRRTAGATAATARGGGKLAAAGDAAADRLAAALATFGKQLDARVAELGAAEATLAAELVACATMFGAAPQPLEGAAALAGDEALAKLARFVESFERARVEVFERQNGAAQKTR